MSLNVRLTATKELRRQAAKALLRIAVQFQTAEKAEWLHGPPRSKDGEHLKMDTMNARDNLAYSPTSIDAVATDLEVRVGYRLNAWYASAWELKGKRIGLFEKLKQFQQARIPANIMGSYER